VKISNALNKFWINYCKKKKNNNNNNNNNINKLEKKGILIIKIIQQHIKKYVVKLV